MAHPNFDAILFDAGGIFLLVPEYLLRFLAFVLTRCIYRFKVKGDERGRGVVTSSMDSPSVSGTTIVRSTVSSATCPVELPGAAVL